MRLDEFATALPLLPEDLRDRAEALRPHLTLNRCTHCRQISDAVNLALMAARYDELASATRQLEAAEALAGAHDRLAAGGCRAGVRRDATARGRGVVTRWTRATTDLVAATDASWKGQVGGIAYVVSDGHFGLRGRRTGRLDPTGPSRAMINELRAVEYLLSGFVTAPDHLTVLVDSLGALTYLHRWQAGDTTAMPTGYDLRARKWDAQPTLVRLAELLPILPGVTFQHVKGHAGHPLNEAADALSHMARRRLTEQFDLHGRASDLVDAFLRDWHTASAAA
ncbi:ribonuclease HI [Planosporangium sp. 12N6]|uniref:ribonuclease HI n=1 Tax=Planosporangium spinosum TaxID=3402278 RepID=UPI003CF673C6